MKEEIVSNKIQRGSRTYFFDVKQTKKGDYYLKISEKKKAESGAETHQLMVFDQDLEEFVETFEKTISELRGLIAQRPQRPAYNSRPTTEGFKPWSAEDDERLRRMFDDGKTEEEIAEALERRIGAVISREKKLGLVGGNEE